MTTYAAEPGTRLGGRYRLEDRIAAGPGWDAWKAIDETLARPVTVFTIAPGFPRIADVVTAARAASRLTDPRLAQVFDVEDSFERAYVVMEWAAGETLGDMLSHGPLEPGRAGRVIAEAAGALSTAHAVGIAHMCLSPGSVRWSPTGEVKVVGLGIDAALSGTAADDPVLADTAGLGRLLYAALTAHWPGPDYPVLPQAPVEDGQPCAPRQVVAGVPIALSDLTCRAMQLPGWAGRAGEAAVTSPQQLARDLLAVVPPAPVPPEWQSDPRTRGHPPDARGRRHAADTGAHRLTPDAGAPWADWPGGAEWPGSADPSGDVTPTSDAPWLRRPGSRRKERAGWLREPGGPGGRRLPGAMPPRLPVALAAAVGAVALVAIAAFALWPGHAGTPPRHPAGSTGPASATILRPVAASGFDPLNPADRGNENSQYAKDAIDASPRTAWSSQWYATAEFGGLKAGSGLIIDMGSAVRISSVTVTFGSAPGAEVSLLAGSSDARSAANLHSMTTLATATSPTGTYTFTVSNQVAARFLVIWFTKLPPEAGSSHKFMASIFDVIVKGSAG